MFQRIDRYVAAHFWMYFLGGLLVFVTIFVAMGSLEMMMAYQGVATDALIRYNGYALPEVIYRMIPAASLFGLVFTLSTLNKSNELIALFSSGMSLFRICAPMLLSVVFLCVVNFIMSDLVLPQFAKYKNYIFYHEIKKNPSLYSMVKTNKIWYRSNDTIFYMKTLNEQSRKAQDLTLYYFNDNWDLIQMITAKEAELTGANWKLFNGSVTVFTEDSSFPLTNDFKTKSIVMGEDAKDLSSTANTSDVLSLQELSQFIKKNKEAGLDTVRYEVDYHSKYGFSMAALIMCLLGIPFSVTRARSGGAMMSIGISLGLVFGYWIFYSSALALGNYGQIPPILAAWVPNLVVGGYAYYNLKKMQI